MGWKQLGSVDPTALLDARLQCHVAATLFARLGRGYLEAKPDDSQTNIGWDRERNMLVGKNIPSMDQPFHLGLDLAELRLSLRRSGGVEESGIALSGKTLEDAIAWVGKILQGAGLALEPLLQPLHFDLPDHPVASGKPFGPVNETFVELSRYYSNTAVAVGELVASDARASEIRCWPHHFDLATLITITGTGEAAKTLGIGFSPGDGSYSQPYLYVSPWPYPDATSLPVFPGPGSWRTEGWTGAILTATELIEAGAGSSQEKVVKTFLNTLHATLSELVTPLRIIDFNI
jgi:hypothetical protein